MSSGWDGKVQAIRGRFWPVGDEITLGEYAGKVLSDGVTSSFRKTIKIPSALEEVGHVYVWVLHTGTNGAIRFSVSTEISGDGEGYQTHTDSISEGDSSSITADTQTKIDISAAFTDVQVGDLVAIEFTRYGAHANDAINDDLFIEGIEITRY